MDRFRKALEEARARREEGLRAEFEQLRSRHAGGELSAGPRFDAATEHRIRRLQPLRGLPTEGLATVSALGQVFGLGSGELVFEAGDAGDFAHFLLEGAVEFRDGDTVVSRLDADDPGALEALDQPGVQPFSLCAARPTRVFRIPRALLEGGPPPSAAVPAPDASDRARLDEALRMLERRLRAHIGNERARERAACEGRFKQQVEALKAAANGELRRRYDELKQRAEDELRRRLAELRRRDRERLQESETLLRERHAQLRRIARRYLRERDELRHARRQLEDKLRAADALHRELAELGRALSLHLEELDGVFDAEGTSALDSTLGQAAPAD
jgi:CRP-like cAMP-binding protein